MNRLDVLALGMFMLAAGIVAKYGLGADLGSRADYFWFAFLVGLGCWALGLKVKL